ncbi:MAG: DUF4307 domain-containing protein [Actinomycetes bacterium]|jgi:hypothetical protein
MSSEPFPRPADRYGDKGKNPWAQVLTAILAVSFVAVIIAVGWHLSTPAFSTEFRAYRIIDDRTVEIEYIVRTRNPNDTVTCIVRARDKQSNEIGRTTKTSSPGQSVQDITVRLRTVVRANLGEIQNCQLTR